jgi:hypothetical protein
MFYIKRIIKELSRKNTNYVTFLVELDSGLGVWKPYIIKDRYKKELLAYEIDKILECNIIPETLECNFDGRCGIVRRYIDGVDGSHGIANVSKVYLQKLAIFDFITFNCDRGLKNIIVSDDSRCYGIDNDVLYIDVFGMSLNLVNLMGQMLELESIYLIERLDKNRKIISERILKYGVSSRFIQWYDRRVQILVNMIDPKSKIWW